MQKFMPRRLNRLDLDDPKHLAARSALRVVGPLVFFLGLAFFLVGTVSFFSAFTQMGSDGFPRYFWCVFVGIPTMWLGGVLSMSVYMGSVVRFMAKEMTPVHRDTFNTMAEGTTDGVRAAAQAFGEGLAAANRPEMAAAAYCPNCGAAVPLGAHFCPGCGKSVEHPA